MYVTASMRKLCMCASQGVTVIRPGEVEGEVEGELEGYKAQSGQQSR